MLRYIFHISDIHIRNGDRNMSRFDEYLQLFNNLFISLKQSIKNMSLDYNDFVIIVSGDVFHNKSVIGNYGLHLYKEFVTNLANIGRTIIFHGNHDKNQNDLDQPSLVSCTVDLNNLMILNHSQAFSINNVGFSYVNIDDTLDPQRTSGRLHDLPPFPIIHDQVDYKVALFHGTFTNVKLYNGKDISDVMDSKRPYPLEWIEEFDFGIFGDIHLRQYNKHKNTLWGYSGSLLQQDLGEDIINHGYLIWDLHNRTIKEVNVYNQYGMMKLKEYDNTLLTFFQNQWIPLKQIIHNYKDQFPNKLNIRLYSKINTQKLSSLLTKNKIEYTITNSVKDNQMSSSLHDRNEDIDISMNSGTILDYFQTQLSKSQYDIFSNIIENNENLLLNTNDYPKELHDDCNKRNKDMSALIQNCIKSRDTQSYREQFYIRYLEWDNLYCYEGKNWVDFQDTANSTFLISGNNGTGKSAIYDILVLAIWGDITIEKQNTLSRGIINAKHDKGHTIIDIELNNTVYRISRAFHIRPDRNLINKINNTLYKYTSDNSIIQLFVDNACNQEIIRLFGTLADFLTSSMITQNLDANILDMDYAKCISLIDKVSNIEYINNLYLLFKGSINKYKDFKKIVESKKQVYDNLSKNTDYNMTDVDTDDIKKELKNLEKHKKELVDENNGLTVRIDKSILSVDYDSAIAQLGDIEIKSEDQFNDVKHKCNTVKKHLQGLSLEPLKKSYNSNVKDEYEQIGEICKPCEYSFISSEESILNKYSNIPVLPSKYEGYTNDQLTELMSTFGGIEDKLRNVQMNKPATPGTIKRPCQYRNLEDLIVTVNEIYKENGLDGLIDYCNNNPNTSTSISSCNRKYEYTYNDYLSLSQEKECIIQQLKTLQDVFNETDANIDSIYKELSSIAVVTEPMTERPSEYFHMLNDQEVHDLYHALAKQERILEDYYAEVDSVSVLEKELQSLKKEYEMLHSQDEYQYNPRCRICCKRPWVLRIHELSKYIKDLEDRIADRYTRLYDESGIEYISVYNDYINLQNKIETNKSNVEWSLYLNYKKMHDGLSQDLNNVLNRKNDLGISIKEHETTLESIQTKLASFHKVSWELYEIYKTIMAHKEYDEWLEEYNTVCEEYADMKQIKKYLFYQNDVVPRKNKLVDLKKEYEQWSHYKSLQKIVFAHDLDVYQKSIEIYEMYKEYQHNKLLQPQIKRKIELQQLIYDIDTKIKEYNNILTSHSAYESIYRVNEENSIILEKSLQRVNDMIDIMTIIIDKFKDYKKHLYDSHILKNIVTTTNSIIKQLCHENTKSFELDYVLSEMKDSIHINWLIKNDICADGKQIISIHQASGFQKFAISIALRMTLFSNKSCSQLFIDEGFTACDKLNLSIVPSFLLRLLNIYNSIIIVSHIDIIQDSVENMVAIQYNNQTKSSCIQYGSYNKPVTQRKQRSI